VFDWNDANRVGDWTFEQNWLQLEDPPVIAFVNITGDNTITLTEDRTINELRIGSHRWDTTRVVLQADLTIYYNDNPLITRVNAERLGNGQTLITVQGTGFGFDSTQISITATEYQSEEDWDHDSIAYQYLQPVVYTCQNVQLLYRDERIQCTIDAPRLAPATMLVTLTSNGNQAVGTLLNSYTQ